MSFLSQPITLQSLFGTKRVIVGGPEISVVIEENTSDRLTITKQPVQQGASITDHAYKEPTLLSMSVQFSDTNLVSGILNTFSGGGLKKIYEDLLEFQIRRTPFDVITPKRIYKSNLLALVTNLTNKQTENVLSIGLSFEQIVIVNIGTVQVDPRKLRSRASNAATQVSGPKSIIVSGVQAFTGR